MVPSPNYGLVRSLRPKAAMERFVAIDAIQHRRRADLDIQFLVPWARVGPMPHLAEDAASGEKLWGWLEEQCRGF